MEKEIRSFISTPGLDGRHLSGYAIVFNSPSQVLVEGGKQFTEVILPGAITSETIDQSDIKMTIEHTSARLLARSNKGRGTLSTTITAKGVKYSFDAPHTADGDFAVEMVSRGDISGASFAFSGVKDKWEKKNGRIIRYIERISRLYDMTLTTDPAYAETDASVRAMLFNGWRERLDARAKTAGLQTSRREEKMKLNYIKAGLPIPEKYK